ncbi:MAG: hypothetical protein JWP25_7525 [Bradyrhizobium sp.]|jgi:hypothetical protein|nr:hypothetical protein [Bradyrhizobium sp.]
MHRYGIMLELKFRAPIAELVLIFHFGIMLGKYEAAIVVQNPKKSGVPSDMVAVPVPNHANRTELMITCSFAEDLHL